MSETKSFPTWLSRLIVEPLAMPTVRARALIKSLTSVTIPVTFDDDDDDDDGCDPTGECVDGYTVANGVATIPIVGVLTKYPSFPSWLDKYFGFVPSTTIQATINRALKDWTVKAIDFLIDCPGGYYAGTNELGDYIAKINGTGPGQKPCYARVSDLAASGGYWIASQCSRITCNPGGFTGCIGVYTVLLDDSKFWADMGISWELISSGGVKGMGADGKVPPELRSDTQREIDAMFARFTGAVAAGRKLSPAQATALGDGRVWMAKEAINLGLIDEALSVEDSLAAILMEVGTMPITPQQFTEHAAANPGAAEVQSLIGQGLNKPATAQELAAAFPGDPAFAMSQLTAGASLNAALTAGCKHLSERLASIGTAHQAEITKLTAAHTEALAAKDKEIERIKLELGGQKPIGSGGVDRNAGKAKSDAEIEAIADPAERAKAEWAKMSAEDKYAWADEATYVATRKRQIAKGE